MLELIILSLVQGVTEFLPISSSSHLIIVSKFLDFTKESLLMNVSLHIGSFLAVLLFFKNEILNFIKYKKIFLFVLPFVYKASANILRPKRRSIRSLFETVLITINDYLVFKFLDKKINFNELTKLIIKISNLKEFQKYKKIMPRNIKQIYNLRDYVHLKLNTLGI